MLTNSHSVVQRQLWLMQNGNLSKSAAYDQARKEFYAHRHQEDIERRVSREEALATGAYFGLSPQEIGMQLEDKEYERWKASAARLAEKRRQLSAGGGGEVPQMEAEGEERVARLGEPVEEEQTEGGMDRQVLEALRDGKAGQDVPMTRRGQEALGGAAVHP